MKRFAETVIKPFLAQNGYCRLCEIGAQFGENTDQLLELGSVHVTVIDPCLDTDLCAKCERDDRLTMHRGLSLEVLPTLTGPFDCILVDGDHNWYTVYHELETINAQGLLRPGGTILLHDVSWPYGRRDMYFQPDTIPEEFQQPFARKGIVGEKSELSDTDGVNGHLCNALTEGGPRNGVLTAVEDFVEIHASDYLFFRLDVQYGLGFLYKRMGGAEDQRFLRFQNDTLRRIRVGRAKDWARDRFPQLYSAVKGVRDAVRGQREPAGPSGDQRGGGSGDS